MRLKINSLGIFSSTVQSSLFALCIDSFAMQNFFLCKPTCLLLLLLLILCCLMLPPKYPEKPCQDQIRIIPMFSNSLHKIRLENCSSITEESPFICDNVSDVWGYYTEQNKSRESAESHCLAKVSPGPPQTLLSLCDTVRSNRKHFIARL